MFDACSPREPTNVAICLNPLKVFSKQDHFALELIKTYRKESLLTQREMEIFDNLELDSCDSKRCLQAWSTTIINYAGAQRERSGTE